MDNNNNIILECLTLVLKINSIILGVLLGMLTYLNYTTQIKLNQWN